MDITLQQTIAQAVEIAIKAIEEDKKGNFEEALGLYEHSGEYFLHAINSKTECETTKQAIRAKLYQYLERAEKIRAFLNKSANENDSSSSNGNEDNQVDTEDETLVSQVKKTILVEKPLVKWSDVAGLDIAKEILNVAIILPTKLPNYFPGQRMPWKSILLYGPTGTGKTYLAKALAAEVNGLTLFSVSFATIISKWMGDSEKLMKHLFDLARAHKPSIIFMDDIEILCTISNKDSETSRRIRGEFLLQMQGFRYDTEGVVVLAATTTPWLLDSATLARFEKRIYIPLPDESARLTMLKMYSPVQLSEKIFRVLAKKTVRYSGADISALMKDATMQPLRKVQTAMHFKSVSGQVTAKPNVIVDNLLTPCYPEDPAASKMSWTDVPWEQVLIPPVTMNDILKSLESVRPTVTKEELKQFQTFEQDNKMCCLIL